MKVEAKKVVDGIAFFSEDRYWGKAPKETLEEALLVLEQKGWDEFNARYRGKFDFTFEENRADFRFAIPVTREFRILDAGAGMGRISIPLARVAGSVVAIDQSFLRMKFLKKRAEAEGLLNIETYVSDLFDAPFEDGSFDLIVMNGLLEWIGATDRFVDPREAQLAALRLCKRLLKKGGYLYIGIENRAALAYIKGRDHSGLRFTSYMPRFVANWYTIVRKGHPYNTYTYNMEGYRTLLRDAGFGTEDFYLVYPGYNAPRILIPYEKLPLLRYVIGHLMQGTSWKRKVVRFLSHSTFLLWLYRKVFFSFSIVARND